MSSERTQPRAVSTPLILGDDGVWSLRAAKDFRYSDGQRIEQYLDKVLRAASDLGSTSDELEAAIYDWPSEYHLTKRRAHLLRALQFKKESSVLEIGPGCGAITRFLGETFARVTSVEGAPERARLARLRNRGQEHVDIVCAPFDEVEFCEKFDVVFCIGVLEYAEIYSAEPEGAHAALIEKFRSLLAPGGILVLAIENQFGLKYFASSAEDHTHRMFDGVEGYPGLSPTPRTFGRDELARLLGEHFAKSEFYFPLPDYKIPTCVVSERMVEKLDAGELFGRFRSRDYMRRTQALFDERLALGELGRNRLLSIFANSFLVVSGVDDATQMPTMNALGVLYRTERAKPWRTVTEFKENDTGGVIASKRLWDPHADACSGSLRLKTGTSPWEPGLSLQEAVYRRVQSPAATLEDVFAPTRVWYEELSRRAHDVAGTAMLGGELLDALWQNSFVDAGACRFIDLEWVWHEDVSLHVTVARAIYVFLDEFRFVARVPRAIPRRRTSVLIADIARTLGFDLSKADLDRFVEFESQLQSHMTGVPVTRCALTIRARLMGKPGPTMRARVTKTTEAATDGLRQVARLAKRRLLPDRDRA